MIGIDTNILIRYITQDGDEAPQATRFLETTLTRDYPGFISLIVVCELVWVLRRAYKYDRDAVSRILETLLSTAEFEIENSLLAWRALQSYRTANADFSDYLIGEIARSQEALPVYTLDRKAGNGENFMLLT